MTAISRIVHLADFIRTTVGLSCKNWKRPRVSIIIANSPKRVDSAALAQNFPETAGLESFGALSADAEIRLEIT